MSVMANIQVEAAWIEECEKRILAIDMGQMKLLDADDVMLKYRSHMTALSIGEETEGVTSNVAIFLS